MNKKQKIPVLQRNFRKYMFFRDWQWYFLVNSTKRFIGQVNIEDEIAALEAEANIHCKVEIEILGQFLHLCIYNSPHMDTNGVNKCTFR